jgi:Na+/melibiose symporter-like transporter
MGLIQKIQSQPQAAKIRIMWVVSIIVAIFLILVWVVSARFGKNVAKNMSLFQTIGQGIHNIKQSYKK